ncbi:hypothetical protein TNCV_1744591 [Trichonephila clavipes]|nr:hypothetical protein TNCV_1744591 [Trichonephila clavipes]
MAVADGPYHFKPRTSERTTHELELEIAISDPKFNTGIRCFLDLNTGIPVLILVLEILEKVFQYILLLSKACGN